MSNGGGHDLLVGPGGHAFKKPGGGSAASGVNSVTAGAGLANSGTAADPIIDIGAGTGITVAADSIAVDTSVIASRAYVDAAVAGAGDITGVTAGTGITGGGASGAVTVAVDQTFAPTWTGAHVWDSEDNGTTSVPSLMTVQHRNNAAGTPAAGYGVGILMKLDSSARTLRSAVEIDAVWSTATDAAEASSLAIKTLVAGVATEVSRFGTGAALPDVDFAFSLGRMLVDSRATDSVYISHRDRTTTSNYGFFQNAAGLTLLNSESGQATHIRCNNVTKFHVNTTGVAFYNGTPAAQQTVTGSRAGNAAVASLLTALATINLIVDSSTA